MLKHQKKAKPALARASKRRTAIFNIGLREEKEYFLDNFAMLLGAGMDVVVVVEAIQQEMRTARMRRALEGLKESLIGGSSIWKALEKSKLFLPQVVALIRIGEESGRLAENLRVIGIQQQKERDLRSKVRSALLYPAFVLSLTIVVGTGVAWFLLPRLAGVFSDLDIELPLITQVLIAVGDFLRANGTIAVPAFLLVLGLLFYFTFLFHKTKFVGQRFLLMLPGVKTLIKEVELSRFGYIVGSLLEAGLSIIDAMDSLQKATTFRRYQNFYAAVRASIEEGNSFQNSFAAVNGIDRLIPAPVQQMIFSAEKSGNLSHTLLNVGHTFEAKTDITTKNLTVILEPLLLVIVWLGVLGVAVAVILPIYSLISGLNA